MSPWTSSLRTRNRDTRKIKRSSSPRMRRFEDTRPSPARMQSNNVKTTRPRSAARHGRRSRASRWYPSFREQREQRDEHDDARSIARGHGFTAARERSPSTSRGRSGRGQSDDAGNGRRESFAKKFSDKPTGARGALEVRAAFPPDDRVDRMGAARLGSFLT